MTEGKNKKCGFIIDPYINRVIKTSIIDYANIIKPDLHPKDAVSYILQERLINLNGDHWMPTFGNHINKLEKICEKIYDIYSSNTASALDSILNRLKFKEILLSKDDQKIFNIMFNNIKPTKEQQKIIENAFNDNKEADEIKKGIEKIKIENEINDDNNDNEDNDDDNNNDNDNDNEDNDDDNNENNENNAIDNKDKKINYIDILKHIIPLISILTIHNNDTTFIEMFKLIENNKNMYDILLDQTKSWWGKNIDKNIIKKFIDIYIHHVKNDKEINIVVRTVKELFIKNISNSKQLSQLIDKYFIPQELEKKTNAEVSTPYNLRQDMISKIPNTFWTKIQKVFEPCSGKGGFIIDIIDKFMDGMKELIPDDKCRYKTIVEECLYFSDINPTNIFICKLLIDPYNEYKLNYNQGNTLEINIKSKWNIVGFDAIIGNPPYNDSSNNKGAGHKIWDKFMYKSINEWLDKNGFLCYVHPPLWRQPHNKLFEIVKNNNLIYLEIHNEKDGNKLFKCSTRYDWYLLQKSKYNNKTIIIDEYNKKNIINLNNWDFIPNGYFNDVKNLIKGTEKHEIIFDRTNYGADKKWVNKEKTDKYKFPIIYSIYKDKSIQYRYSCKNSNGHFGIPKIIFTPNLGLNYIIDSHGLYGLTQWVVGIHGDTEELEQITKIFNNIRFKEVLKCIKYGMYYNNHILKMFKKDFWKDFI